MVKHTRTRGSSTTKTLVTALAVAAIGVGVAVPAASAQPNAQSCQGDIVSSSVQPSAFGPGRRAVATLFFGDYPTAVRDGEQAVQEFCAS